MKRHPALAGLSRDHHSALVLARALSVDTPLELRGGLPRGGEALLAEVRRRFEVELLPHFAIEERELLPLSDCGGVELRDHAARIRREHAELRELAASMRLDDDGRGGEAFGELLTAHVRFEEQQWFAALEVSLDAPTLDALARRLRSEPESLVTGFRCEGEGVWVAELDCGHTFHVRHRPPQHEAPWLESEAGRAERIGSAAPCRFCRMPRLPPCARVYKSTPVFDRGSVPAGLLRSHALKAGTWGRIEVSAGRVGYVLEDEGDLQLVLRPGVDGTVAPERPHHVEPGPDARFQVHFLRCDPG